MILIYFYYGCAATPSNTKFRYMYVYYYVSYDLKLIGLGSEFSLYIVFQLKLHILVFCSDW